MKKRILAALLLTLILVTVMAGSVFAADAQVDIDVDYETVYAPDVWWAPCYAGFYEGSIIRVFGTVTATADVESVLAYTYAETSVRAVIVMPDGTEIDIGSDYDFDSDIGLFSESYCTSMLDIDFTITLNSQGVWVIELSGEAEAGAIPWIWVYAHDEIIRLISLDVYRVPDFPVPWTAFGFTVYINNEYTNWQSSAWDSVLDRITSNAIDLIADGIRVQIPAGTVVNGDAYCLAGALGINYLNGVLSFDTQYITFDKPVVVTNVVTGDVISEFTEIVAGVPQ